MLNWIWNLKNTVDQQAYTYINRNIPFTFRINGDSNCCRGSVSADYFTKLLESGLNSVESQEGRLTGKKGCGCGVTSKLPEGTEKAYENLRSRLRVKPSTSHSGVMCVTAKLTCPVVDIMTWRSLIIYIVTCYATEDAVQIVYWFYYNLTLTITYNTITSLH
jgi:hypothetical protein